MKIMLLVIPRCAIAYLGRAFGRQLSTEAIGPQKAQPIWLLKSFILTS